MRVNRQSLLLVLLAAVPSLGATCIGINDPGVFSINVKDVTGTYNISAGTTQFGNPPGSTSCVTKNPADYMDHNFTVKGARLVDVTVTANGSFAGSVSNGLVTINGQPLVRYNGTWSAFNTAQSLLTSTLLTRDPLGTATLINAITGSVPVTLCASGAFSQAATAGLSVSVQVFAQVDGQP